MIASPPRDAVLRSPSALRPRVEPFAMYASQKDSAGLHRATPTENTGQRGALLVFGDFRAGTLPHSRSMKIPRTLRGGGGFAEPFTWMTRASTGSKLTAAMQCPRRSSGAHGARPLGERVLVDDQTLIPGRAAVYPAVRMSRDVLGPARPSL